MVSTDDERKSIERAKASGLALAGLGLNILLPGGGSLAIRLGQHIYELVRDQRLGRLEDFHRRVFEGDIGEHEINERFKAMEDGDFQTLLTCMLTDIEAEKVALYSDVYIYLVENSSNLTTAMKQAWVVAVSQLRLGDYADLRDAVNEGWRFAGPSSHRLASVGAITLAGSPPSTAIPSGAHVELVFQATSFGRQLLERLERHLSS